MDFRGVDPRDLRWSKTPRGAGVRGAAPGRVCVQTPCVPCRVTPMASQCSQGWTLELQFADADPAASAFADFVEAVMASAVAWGGMAGGQEPAAAVTRGLTGRSLRVTAFSDALFFDAQGAAMAEPLKPHASATCLLELQGAWVSAARWGLRWRVTQVKMAEAGGAAPVAAFAFVADDE